MHNNAHLFLQELLISIITAALKTPEDRSDSSADALEVLRLCQFPSASEVTLTAFPSVNPLTAARLISLKCTLSELLGLNDDEQRQLTQKLPDVPSHSLEQFFLQGMYGQPITGIANQLAYACDSDHMDQQAQHIESAHLQRNESGGHSGLPNSTYTQDHSATPHDQGFSSAGHHMPQQHIMSSSNHLQHASPSLEPVLEHWADEYSPFAGEQLHHRWQPNSCHSANDAYDNAPAPAVAQSGLAADHRQPAATAHLNPHTSNGSHAQYAYSNPSRPHNSAHSLEAAGKRPPPGGNPFSGFSYHPKSASDAHAADMHGAQPSTQHAQEHYADAALMHEPEHLEVEEVCERDQMTGARDAFDLKGYTPHMALPNRAACGQYRPQRQQGHQENPEQQRQQLLHRQRQGFPQQVQQHMLQHQHQQPRNWDQFLPEEDHSGLQAPGMELEDFGENPMMLASLPTSTF